MTAIVFPHRRIRATCLLSKDIIQDPHSSTGKSDDTKPTINEPNDSLSICTSKKTYASRVMTENIVDLKYDRKDVAIRAVIQEIFATLADVAKLNPFFREHISQHNAPIDVFSSPSKLADFVAIMSAEEGDTLQEILEETNVEEKMRKALVVLKRELVAAQLQHSIGKDVELKMTQKQREYFLHEQLKVIKKELGLETDSKEKIIYVLREKESVLEMPTLIKSAFEEEINKLSVLEPSSSEFGVTRAYLEWLTGIPWGKKNTECLDIERAKKILDEDHYGMKDVKDRILEFMAVSQLLKKYNSNKKSIENAESSPLSSNHRGKILLLVGPPGVGKTSIGKSVANALGREYFRFSVGGLSDVAEIKGHRRTYVGAMPGKIVQALKQVKTLNPLIMIDEIDKLGRGNQGDPASALLEILDPEQNCSFLDHYIDLPIDLSDVLFICTANQLESISGPLIDRMEVISLSGYVSEEKIHIANKYLIPQALKDAGIDDSAVSLTEDSVKALIKQYCRESGVRNLKKHIEKIFRKAALRIVNQNMEYKTKIKCENSQNLVVQNSDESILTNKLESTSDLDKIIIQPENLKELIGVAPFISDRLYDQDLLPPGVVTGLAWTAMGGSILYIETIAHNARLGPSFSKSQSSTEVEDAKELEKQPSLIRTGQMGDVMKESTHIAYSFSKSFMAQNYPNNSFLRNNSLHLHVPEGATPKDGPSAGSTMATSLISLALNIQIPSNVAMTGELSLTGKILRIGGVKEKTIAARRSGINTIILPKTNEADWVELPDYIRSNLDAKFVNTFDEIAKILKLA